jgi:hypothetical protein
MQGLEALDQFKNFVSKIGGLGRYEDTYIVHAAEGETVVPMEVLDQNPVLKKRLFKTMVEMGIEPGRYIVGNELNSKNPITGQPEFFLKKIVSQIRKALPGDSEKYLGTIVGLATGNPYLGAIAGGVGSGMSGAIGGGLAGYQSPGIKGLGRGFLDYQGAGKVDAMNLRDIFSREGGADFLFGKGDKGGLFGKFDFAKGDTAGTDGTGVRKLGGKLTGGPDIPLDQLEKASKAKEGVLGGMSIMDAAKLYGLGTVGLGVLIQLMEGEQGDVGEQYEYDPTNEVYYNVINQRPIFPRGKAEGGVMDLQDGGESKGPGTGTSDSIPAMLSDGEFVMTAKAVRGAGGGDRREGARKMYEAMDKLEARA